MPDKPTVLFETEGSYPFSGGGVSTWAHILCSELEQKVDFVLYPLTGKPFVESRYKLTSNVKSIVHVPLWGVEEPVEFYDKDTPFSEQVERKYRTTDKAVKELYFPIFRDFIDRLLDPFQPAHEYGDILYGFWKYFNSEEYGYGLYEVFRKRIIETRSRYPFIRFLSAKEAVPIVQDWARAKLDNTYLTNRTIGYEYKINNRSYLDVSADSSVFWFMYVDQSDKELISNRLKEITEDFSISEYWDGSLIQFATNRDSIYLPDLSARNRIEPHIIANTQKRILSNYRSYIAADVEGNSESESQAQRYRYALAALNKNPESKGIQERVIDLALEQEQVDVAIKILERRLLNNGSKEWDKNDLDRLFTYYGWEGRVQDAWLLLDQLWGQHQNYEVISAKDKLVNMYSYPDDESRDRWIDRELAINPNDEELISTFVTLNQSEENWSRVKGYLKRMISLNRQTDSLYHYTLQRSFYYDEPEETIELLNSFPESAKPQLLPLANDVANLYAYTAGNYSEALEWSESEDDFPVRTELEWLLQQKRYNAFIQKGDRYLALHPEDDSMRVFFGQQLIFEGFSDQGYEKLYPLFQKETAPTATRRLVHTEIGYKPYPDKKSFYKTYPAFFSDSLKLDLKEQYRLQEGVKAGLSASYASDNFDNNIAKTGLSEEWGNRQSYTHHIALEEILLGSDFNGSSAFDQLTYLGYHYRRKYREQSMQSTIGGGLYYTDGEVKANAELGFWYAKDSTLTSGEAIVEPVLTNTAVQQDINQYKLSVYREDFWANGRVQTTGSGSANYYTDEVFSFETLGRAYVQLPFSTAHWRYRGVAELSYSDASTSYTSGIPYYTPGNLLIEGVGLDFRYRDIIQNPDLSVELELMGKNDSRDGLFLTSAVRLNARIEKYWELSLNAEISSSSVYRYNNFGFTLSYIFPRKLPE